jgi:hypothetical protein
MTCAALRVQRYRIVQTCVPRTYCATVCPSPTMRVQLVPGTSLLPRGTVPIPSRLIPYEERCRMAKCLGSHPPVSLAFLGREGNRREETEETTSTRSMIILLHLCQLGARAGADHTHCKPLMQHRLRGAPGSWEVGVGGFGVEVCTGTVRSEWYGQPGM